MNHTRRNHSEEFFFWIKFCDAAKDRARLANSGELLLLNVFNVWNALFRRNLLDGGRQRRRASSFFLRSVLPRCRALIIRGKKTPNPIHPS